MNNELEIALCLIALICWMFYLILTPTPIEKAIKKDLKEYRKHIIKETK